MFSQKNNDMTNLLELDSKASAAMQDNDYVSAIKFFESIIALQADYEHGMTLYELASCYEEIGNTTKAKELYKKCISYDKNNTIFQGGYASFLFLHGNAEEAILQYEKLIELNNLAKNYHGVKLAKQAIDSLKEKERGSKHG